MIDLSTLLLFVGATALLIAIPGPVVGLILSETLKHGMRYGFMVSFGAGTISFLFLMLYIAGAAPLFAMLDGYFDIIRYCGVLYLLYLGITSIKNANKEAEDIVIKARTPFDAYKSSLIITASSPKTILFFAAFFPQFLDETKDLADQLIVLSIVFILVSISLDSIWVFIAGRARKSLSAPGMQKRINIIAGVILCIAASILLVI